MMPWPSGQRAGRGARWWQDPGGTPPIDDDSYMIRVWTGAAWELKPLLVWDGEWKPLSLMRRSETAWESLP